MSRFESQSSSGSSISSDSSLFANKVLTVCSDQSDQNQNQIKLSEELTNSQTTDRIGVRKSTELGVFCRQMSQTSVDKMEEWKGSQVVNFKTFKKVSQNSSQTRCQTVIPMKRVKPDSINTCDQNPYNYDIRDKEISIKRKIDCNVETIIEKRAQKKSRLNSYDI